MAQLIKAIRGTQDILPDKSYQWQTVERFIADSAKVFGFSEIRTPVFENTELFQRSVGTDTDVVQKEMYTFTTKGGDSVTLRPEGTAGAVRAMLEHSLYNEGLPIKAFYFTSCYRYEKPQKGRLREFHQFGAEIFGTSSPAADAELISLANSIFDDLGVADDLSLEINSIGCPECRAVYRQALKDYFKSHSESLCPTCLDRLERNPMRVLDCKNPSCKEIAESAPVILDYLCEPCVEHFEAVQKFLGHMELVYTINPRIVRGLDYYTRTVFEFVSQSIGAQGTVCGGGRYDGLVKEMGGPDMPSLGFAMGLERLMLLLEASESALPEADPCQLYVIGLGEEALLESMLVVQEARQSGFSAAFDITGRNLKAQMKYADKIGAVFTIVLGENEIVSGKCGMKNMQTGVIETVEIDEINQRLYDVSLAKTAELLGGHDEAIDTLKTIFSDFSDLLE